MTNRNYKIHSIAFSFAYLLMTIKNQGIELFSFGQFLTIAWILAKGQLSKEQTIFFVRSNGEKRVARVKKIVSIEKTINKGFVRFIEVDENGNEKFRSFRFERYDFEAHKAAKQRKDSDTKETKIIKLQSKKQAIAA